MTTFNFPTSDGWAPWRASVIQLLGSRGWWITWDREHCSSLLYGDRASALSSASICVGSAEARTTRSSKEGRTGPGRKRSRQKSPCGAVVGLRSWIGSGQQPGQYSETQSFFFLPPPPDFFSFSLFIFPFDYFFHFLYSFSWYTRFCSFFSFFFWLWVVLFIFICFF